MKKKPKLNFETLPKAWRTIAPDHFKRLQGSLEAKCKEMTFWSKA